MKDRLTVEVRGPKWFDVKNGAERTRTCEKDREEWESEREGEKRWLEREKETNAGVRERERERDSLNATEVGEDNITWWG